MTFLGPHRKHFLFRWTISICRTFYILNPILPSLILWGHTISTSKLFLTSNEDFGDRHLSYWSSSHFFKDETTNHPERKEKSFIQYWFLHTAPLYITPKYFIFHSHTTTNACNILSLHRLSLCLVNIKSQVREYQKNKKKHPFRHGVCRSINPRVQSAANSTIEKSFLFSSRLFRYAYNRMTRGCIL